MKKDNFVADRDHASTKERDRDRLLPYLAETTGSPLQEVAHKTPALSFAPFFLIFNKKEGKKYILFHEPILLLNLLSSSVLSKKSQLTWRDRDR